MNAQMITALRKEGKVDEAYQLSKEMLSAGTTDSAVISAFSWVLWQKMKQLSQDSSALPDFIGYLTELAMLNLENTEFNFTLFDTLRTNIAKLATELCRYKEKSPAILSHELDSLFQIFCLMPMRHFNEYRSSSSRALQTSVGPLYLTLPHGSAGTTLTTQSTRRQGTMGISSPQQPRA